MIDPQAVANEFTELVRIDSPSLHERSVAEVVMGKLHDMGVSSSRDHAGEALGGDCGNVIARVPASAAGKPTVMINAHLDTVEPGCGIEASCQGDVICSAGSTILGADDKAGVAIILAALREIANRHFPHGELQIVFTVAEEIGLRGAQSLDYSQLKPDYCLVFDGGYEIGSLTIAAPSARKMTWQVRGLPAHAGVCPEKGVNAVQIASRAIAAMKMGRLDEESTANIGRIEGGLARNIVPESCEIWGEARSHDEAKLEAQVQHMHQCFADAAAEFPAARLEEDVQSSYRRFRLDGEAAPVRVADAAATALGLPVKHLVGGGGSDANIFNERGIPSVICACGARNPHTLEEQASILAMARGAEWLVKMIEIGS